METRRVVITGIGSISAIGLNTKEFWHSVCNGQGGIAPMTTLPHDQIKCRYGAEIKGYDPQQHFTASQLTVYWRNSQLPIIAAREAIADSGIDFKTKDPFESGILMGSTSTQGVEEEDFFKRYYETGSKRVHPLTLVHHMRGGLIHEIASEYNIHGPGFIMDSACSSALLAIGEAFQMIRYGRLNYAIAGGGECPFGITHWKAWEQIGALSPDMCRPFSKERNGTILGEGAGVFVLESLDSAKKRSAKIYAEVLGFASSRDAEDLTRPSLERITQTIELCLKDAKLSKAEYDYISAHGSGTLLNDVVETKAIKRVFGSHAENLAISSTKAMHGHLEFATGALELVGAVLAIKEGVLPPTLNYLSADPDCDLDYVPNHAREKKIKAVLKNSFGFGGANAVLSLKNYS